MTYLKKLEQVAAGRTKGASIQQQPNGKHILDCFSGPADAQFIALVSNCWPEIEAVLVGMRLAFERAHKIPIEFAEASAALKALETKLAGMEEL